MYCAVPSEEVAWISPELAQWPFHQDDWVDSSVEAAVVASLPIRVEAVLVALPPVHAGEAMTTRNEPLELGVKETWTSVELTTDAVTLVPPAVIALIAPKVCPDEPVWELSAHVWARLPIAPDAAAVGLRPLHRCRSAVS